MSIVRRVLVGADFDVASGSAIRIAGELASVFGATVVAVHATSIDQPAYFTASQLATLERERAAALGRIAGELEAFASRHTPVPIVARADEGPAADVILRHAADVDLVVVGTRRLRGARRWWLGSVAEAVVRRAPVPVLVVPGGPSAIDIFARGATLLAAESAGAGAERWIEALRDRAGMAVTRARSLTGCPVADLQRADLIVVPLGREDAGGPDLAAIGDVLQECARPVLFVPAAAGVEGV